MKDKKGFTLLELLLVFTLLLVVFGVIGLSFTGNIKGNIELSAKVNKTVEGLSIYNQIAKQFFSGYTERRINIKLDGDRLSFYTRYPLFFPGVVRAEYYIEKDEDGKEKLIYEEFPYVDGKLGYPGLKKQVLGTFKDVKFEAYKGSRFYNSFSGKKFPSVIKIYLDGHEFYVYSGR